MATIPTACFIGKQTTRTIWSVDDAWFEGSSSDDFTAQANEQNYSIADYELGVSFVDSNSTTKNEDTRLLNNSIESSLTWDQTRNKIKVREASSEPIILQGEWLYFKTLFRLCYSHQIQLVLCNFEYLEQAFHICNRTNNAILVDIQYDKAPPDYSAQYYGIDLIAQLLNGQRNYADIFFVTSFQNTIRERIEQNENSSIWWVMRTLPFVSKSYHDADTKNLEQELNRFFNYYTEGAKLSLNQSIEELWNYLVECHLEDFTHPFLFDDIPENFFLKEYFNPWNDDHAESFKAIYRYEDPPTLPRPKGVRKILIDILKSHLDYLKIKINITKNVPPDNNYLKLPVQPGMLFFINLLYFLHRLNEKREHVIDLEIDNSGTQGIATLRIPLNPEKNPEALKQSVVTGNRKTMEAFRSLVACKELLQFTSEEGKTLTLVSDDFRDKTNSLIKTWQANKLVDGHERIYYQLIDYKFEGHNLFLSWVYD